MATNDFIDGSLLEWLAASGFFIAIMLAGVVFVRRGGGASDALTLLPLGGVAGITVYVLAVNALGYFLPIKLVFWLVFLGMVIGALALETRARVKGAAGPFFEPSGVSRRLAFGTIGLSVFASLTSLFTTLKVFLHDDLAPSHLPTTLLISRGRFPVEEPGLPGADFAYHYGPDLLAAATQNIAGLPAWYGYDVQIAVFALLMFPMALVLARLTCGLVTGHRGTTSAAPFVAALLVWGSPWNWLEYFREPEVPDALRSVLSDPFGGAAWLGNRYLSIGDIAQGRTVTSIFAAMHNHSTAMGYVVVLAALYWLVRAVECTSPIRSRAFISAAVLSVLSFALMALSTETILAILVPGILAYCVLESVRHRSWQPIARTGLIVSVSAFVIKIQGGALSDPIPYVDDGPTFELTRDFGALVTFRGPIDLLSWRFLIEWLPVISLALAVFVVLLVRAIRGSERGSRSLSMTVGMLVAAFATWLVPIVLFYVPSPVEAIRFFFPAMVLFSAVAGVAVARIWVARFGRIIGTTLIAAMVLTSINFQVHHSFMTMGTVLFLSEGAPISSPRPAITAPAAARIPYAPTRNDLEDLEFIWKLPDDTIIFSAAPNGVHPNLELSGLQMQRTYFDERLVRFNKVASELEFEDLRKLGVDVLYVERSAAEEYDLPIDKLENDPRYEKIYENGRGDDRRVIYRLRGA